MHKFYTSSYDSSIYLQQPEQNAGRDGLLEVGKLYYGDTKDIARALIKFDVSTLETGSNWKAYLNLKAAGSEEIPLQYTIHANAVSQSWNMGSGTKYDNITSDGVSWKYRNGTDKWVSYDTTGGTMTYVNTGTTGSLNAEGGIWYTGSAASQSFDYENDDIRMDVTDLISLWLSGSITNNGMIIHHTLAAENDALDYGILKFFSKETNTIYEPKLEIVWNDYSFSSSLAPVTGSAQEGYKVVMTNLKSKYQKDSLIRLRVKGRDMFPLKSFGSTYELDQSKYLPTTTYYQLEDYVTGEVIYPFGEYTKVSCDNTSNYFNMNLNTLPANRTYKIKLKIVESGISTIIDDKLIFEIIE